MKILILTNSDILSVPLVRALNQSNSLGGVGILKKNQAVLCPAIEALDIPMTDVLMLERRSWEETLSEFVVANAIDYVWVLTFPWIIPSRLLQRFSNRFVNFHFGLLPKYKGADPVFWQLKNREKTGGVAIHLMNEKIDEGPVLMQKELYIIPGENYGLHCKRLGELLPSLIDELTQELDKSEIETEVLDFTHTQYDRQPNVQDLTIRWAEQTAEEIEWLVNASNPKYAGAQTTIAGFDMRVLEVTPVNMEASVEAKPGQIVHADVVYGLVVACKNNEYLRITIVQTAEGYLSGVKLFNLGFMTGHQFES